MSTAIARSALRQAVSRLLGESIVGVPGSDFAVNAFGCAKLAVYANDYFNDFSGRFYSGTHLNTDFTVTDFVKTAGVVTFSPSVSGAVDATDLFEMYPDFTPAEINDAINLALSMVEEEALQDKVDATLAVIASTFEYAIPTGFVYIDQIFQETSTADRYSPSGNLIDVRHWRVLHGSTPKVWFDNEYVSLTTGRNLRLVGQQYPAQLSLDADECAVSQAYIVYQAKANLHFSRVDEQGDAHWNKMVAAQSRATEERKRIRVAGRGQRVSF